MGIIKTQYQQISGIKFLTLVIKFIGDLSGVMGDVIPTGLTYDFTTSTMYATTSIDLFEVDLTTAAVTQIGVLVQLGQ